MAGGGRDRNPNVENYPCLRTALLGCGPWKSCMGFRAELWGGLVRSLGLRIEGLGMSGV